MRDYLEVINPRYERGHFRFALYDFDGTLSLIREGWQKIMKDYFWEALRATPGGAAEDEKALRKCISDFVDVNTGKQTIYQCFALVEEMKKRGGEPLEALAYKEEYHRRLLESIHYRIGGLERKTIRPQEYLVPGGIELLRTLKTRGVKQFIASGTDEPYARHEADLLGVTPYIEGQVYGAQTDYLKFSKKMVIERIIRENNLSGNEFVGFGDGFVEIENVKERGGFAVGVATDEKDRSGRPDEWKRERLIRAGADVIIPDFSQTELLVKYLYKEE